jgi:ankyrin repeat protein
MFNHSNHFFKFALLCYFLQFALFFHPMIDGLEVSKKRKELSQAFEQENAKQVKSIIDSKKVDLNSQTSDGETALMFAIDSTKTDVLSILIKNGASLEQVDSKGKTALIYAIEKNSTPSVQILIKAGANIHAVDSEGNPAFMYALSSGNQSILELFYQAKVDFNILNKKNQNALFFVTDPQTAQFLLDQGLNIEHRDHFGNTPFLAAALANKTSIAMYLHSKGANIVVADNKGYTALFPVAKNGNLALLQLLIDNKIPLDLADGYGYTPLMDAIINNHFYVVDCLIKAGASYKTYSWYACTLTIYPTFKKYSIPAYTTPLDLAKILDRKEIVDLLTPLY